MIEKIAITNFKSHAHTEIELGRVTALVGPNGCGKTGLLRAIYSLCGLANNSAAQIFSGENSPDFLVRGNGNNFSIEAFSLTAPRWQVAVKLSAGGDYLGQIRSWNLQVDGNWMSSPVGVGGASLNNIQALSNYLPPEMVQRFGHVELFQASPQKLSQPSPVDQTPPVLSFDGSGLSSVIANLILADSETHKTIEEELCKIVPTVRKVRARQTQVQETERVYSVTENGFPRSQVRNVPKPGYELMFDTLSANSIPAHAMSEGTMLVLGMLTLLHGPYPPALFLIDDVEHGLHPIAQRKIVGIFKRIAESQKLQIILTSHSPYIVDELEAKDVWVMATDQEGISHCQRLDKGPNAKFALEVLTTGEFLGAEGEDWVLDPPVQEDPVHV